MWQAIWKYFFRSTSPAPGIRATLVPADLTSFSLAAPGYWTQTTGSTLAQGDYLRDCLLPIFSPDLNIESVGDSQTHGISVGKIDLIVLTQSCDLANEKTQFAALCPIYRIDEYSEINKKFARKDEREETRKGRREGLHMLGSLSEPNDNSGAFVVDFRIVHSLPVEYLRKHASSLGVRWRLQSPFLEHFSQAFARFFMRVGLPSSIPSFK